MRRATTASLFVAGLLAVAALPVLGRAVRGDRGDRCALDGVVVGKTTQVRIVDGDGRPLRFCCVDCASAWLAKSGSPPRESRVVDETSGDEISADEAWFVSSRVVAFPPTGCRIHVFAHEADARRHAEAFRGMVLTGGERPLRRTGPLEGR